MIKVSKDYNRLTRRHGMITIPNPFHIQPFNKARFNGNAESNSVFAYSHTHGVGSCSLTHCTHYSTYIVLAFGPKYEKGSYDAR